MERTFTSIFYENQQRTFPMQFQPCLPFFLTLRGGSNHEFRGIMRVSDSELPFCLLQFEIIASLERVLKQNWESQQRQMVHNRGRPPPS